MSVLTNKYTPAEMSPQELQATFTAREHTVDYLLKSLRDQIHSRTLSSHVITGPRGAGKSTVIQMVALRIGQESELMAAWIPLVFPEEQFEMISLRDMLAAILRKLGKENPQALDWLTKVEEEKNDEQSEQLAITGLKEITRQTGKRLVLFIENLDQLLENHLDDLMKGTLRRLLMTDPFMMIIGSTVHVFDSLKNYDKAFFNYFDQVPLHRLNAAQITELLKKRAQYDGNDQFLRNLPSQQAKIRTLVHLTGGNPRLALMLYELLSSQKVTTIVQYLRRLVDELTPLLKHEMENLPPQQQKIIHALMEKGGTAQPTDLVDPTRLPLNAITTQLKRLKDAQIVEVLGGGKGRAAHYTVPDKLFSIWYQMRYLNQNRRRIEMFVEVLRVWFEEEERILTLQALADGAKTGAPQALRECATTGEYFAASLKGTKHELIATDLCIRGWLRTDIKEAAFAYADLSQANATASNYSDTTAQAKLAAWCMTHNDPHQALIILNAVLADSNRTDTKVAIGALLLRTLAKEYAGDPKGSIDDASRLIGGMSGAVPPEIVAQAYYVRGVGKGEIGDLAGAVTDYTSFIEAKVTTRDMGQIASAMISRGLNEGKLNNNDAALRDFNAVIAVDNLSEDITLKAFLNRGFLKKRTGNLNEAVLDFTTICDSKNAPIDLKARALHERAKIKYENGDVHGAKADFSSVIELTGAPENETAEALFGRGILKFELGDIQGAIDDYNAAIDSGKLRDQFKRRIILIRGLSYACLGKLDEAAANLMELMNQSSEFDEFMYDVVEHLFKMAWGLNQIYALQVLEKLSVRLNNSTKTVASEAVLRLLRGWASSEMKDAWLYALHFLSTNLNPELAESVKFFEPVAHVLEGKDPSSLDALPPEQRDFAFKVLEKFTS